MDKELSQSQEKTINWRGIVKTLLKFVLLITVLQYATMFLIVLVQFRSSLILNNPLIEEKVIESVSKAIENSQLPEKQKRKMVIVLKDNLKNYENYYKKIEPYLDSSYKLLGISLINPYIYVDLFKAVGYLNALDNSIKMDIYLMEERK
jgi:dephospho-CoA kinase